MFGFRKKQTINDNTTNLKLSIEHDIPFEDIKEYFIETCFVKNNLYAESVDIENEQESCKYLGKRERYYMTIKIKNCDLLFNFKVNYYKNEKEWKGIFSIISPFYFQAKRTEFNICRIINNNYILLTFPDHPILPFIQPSIMVKDEYYNYINTKTRKRTEHLYSMGLKPKNKHIKAIRKAKQ